MPAEIERPEAAIDVKWNEELGPLENPILPGGSMLDCPGAYLLQPCARKAERRCQQLNAIEPLAGVGLAYINRLL